MKIFIGVALLILCSLVGYKLSEKYVLRKKFYKDFVAFNDKLLREISFLHTTLMSIVDDITVDSDFYNIVNNYIKKGEFKFEKKYINLEEKEYFYKYLNVIGSGDKNSQLKFLSAIEIELKAKKASADDDEKKYKSLYLKLGFLLGLISLIILL